MLGLFLAIVALAPGHLAMANFEAGIEAYKKGDYATAIDAWLIEAASENPRALFNLAQMYRLGVGVAPDLLLAEQYYRRAAIRGHVGAQSNLGSMYYQRNPPQATEAIYFWRHAARGGDARSQYLLGIQYFNAEHVVQDYVLAYAWVSLAADAGLADAINALELMAQYLDESEVKEGRELAKTLLSDDNALALVKRETQGSQQPPTTSAPNRNDQAETAIASATAPPEPPKAAGDSSATEETPTEIAQNTSTPVDVAVPEPAEISDDMVSDEIAQPVAEEISSPPDTPESAPSIPNIPAPEVTASKALPIELPVSSEQLKPPPPQPEPGEVADTENPTAVPEVSEVKPAELTAPVDDEPTPEPVAAVTDPETVPRQRDLEPVSQANTPAPPDQPVLPEKLLSDSPGAVVYKVQFASLETAEDAETTRANLLKRHGDILSRVDLQIDEADLGPDLGHFFRIKTGALVDQKTSEALCAVMESRKVSCLSVKSVQIVATTTPPRRVIAAPPPPLPPVMVETNKVADVEPEPTTQPPVQPQVAPAANDKYRVQVAAHRSAPEARAHWDRLVGKHAALLEAVKLYVHEVELPGRGTYFRVQIGPFADRGNANDFCASLKENRIDCFVVKTPS